MANTTREKTIVLLFIFTLCKASLDLSSGEIKRFLLTDLLVLFGSSGGHSCTNEWSTSSCLVVFLEGKCGSNHTESERCKETCGFCAGTNHSTSNLARITHPSSITTWTTQSTDGATIAPPVVQHIMTTSSVTTSVTVAPQGVIDGRWGDWSPWSSCTSTCGLAIKKRTRQCANPPPTNGGQVCHGPSDDSVLCTLSPCIYT